MGQQSLVALSTPVNVGHKSTTLPPDIRVMVKDARIFTCFPTYKYTTRLPSSSPCLSSQFLQHPPRDGRMGDGYWVLREQEMDQLISRTACVDPPLFIEAVVNVFHMDDFPVSWQFCMSFALLVKSLADAWPPTHCGMMKKRGRLSSPQGMV